MKHKRLAIMMLAVAMLFVTAVANAHQPKYVFFFLGDGMANSQIQATEAYLTTLNGGSATLATDLWNPDNRLNMSKMPVQGMQTTYDTHALMTDSASAGTAFACGLKTMSGTIGMDETKTISYKSVVQLAHERVSVQMSSCSVMARSGATITTAPDPSSERTSTGRSCQKPPARISSIIPVAE